MVYTHHICATEDTTSHRCACTRANSRYTCLLVYSIHIVKMRVCMRICRLPIVLYYIYVRYKFNAGGRCLSRVHAHLRIRFILSVYTCRIMSVCRVCRCACTRVGGCRFLYGLYSSCMCYRGHDEPQMRMHTRKLTLYMSVGIWYTYARVHAHLQLVVSSVAHI